jgi:phosphonate transport system ATP-binding protein
MAGAMRRVVQVTEGSVLAAAPILSLEGVTIGPPGGRAVLRDVQLKLAAGERIALVGPSGSGKTTLLRTLNGQIPPLAGEVRLAGEPFSSLRGEGLRRARRQVALVAQKHDLVDTLPVHANVMAGALGRWSNLRALRYLIRPRAAELAEAEAALAAVGIQQKLHAPTAQLSGGEQQRAAIARALVQGPLVFLADEPVAALDPRTAGEVLELLTELAQARGMGLICSLHQPELAARHFDRVLQLSDARLAPAGPFS